MILLENITYGKKQKIKSCLLVSIILLSKIYDLRYNTFIFIISTNICKRLNCKLNSFTQTRNLKQITFHLFLDLITLD